jgi:REP-associated tyrosine transposase
MPRPPRPVADGLLYHALNRGNNREAVFVSPEDYRQFLGALTQTKERYPFRLFGYCLMTNHFHLLLAPDPGQSISRILPSLTVAHTWHYHKTHHTSGHVWQGRFKSPVVQHDAYALTVLRYIEGNPWRAGMVADLADYPWSSYVHHGLGQPELLLSALPGHEEVLANRRWWRQWVHEPLTEKELSGARKSVLSGRPFGEVSWAEKTARALGLKGPPRPRGRPRKDAKK